MFEEKFASIAALIQKHKLLAHRSLGQNFLVDNNISHKIVNLLEIEPQDTIIEVGPGLGSLTRCILAKPFKRLVLIEKDKRFLPLLHDLTSQHQNVEILNQDALDATFTYDPDIKMISNLPYNVGSRLVIEWSKKRIFKTMVLMFQKEVAQRLRAHPRSKDYSKLSIVVQNFYSPHHHFNVPPTVFWPPPKVISSVVSLKRLERPVTSCNWDIFNQLVSYLFQHRRKTLHNLLKTLTPLHYEKILREIHLDPKERPENLTIAQLGTLAHIYGSFIL